MCIDQTYCYLLRKYYWGSFYNHFSLCIKVVQKLYRNGPPSCTEVVQADSACSSCTEIGLYQSRPPPCPKVVMYRTGPNPFRTMDCSYHGRFVRWTIRTTDDSYYGFFVPFVNFSHHTNCGCKGVPPSCLSNASRPRRKTSYGISMRYCCFDLFSVCTYFIGRMNSWTRLFAWNIDNKHW